MLSWYILQVYSGNEKKIEKELLAQIEKKGLKENIEQIINTLAMASPFSLEEKQALLESQNIFERKLPIKSCSSKEGILSFKP